VQQLLLGATNSTKWFLLRKGEEEVVEALQEAQQRERERALEQAQESERQARQELQQQRKRQEGGVSRSEAGGVSRSEAGGVSRSEAGGGVSRSEAGLQEAQQREGERALQVWRGACCCTALAAPAARSAVPNAYVGGPPAACGALTYAGGPPAVQLPHVARATNADVC
jgi:hypothetical protein